MTAVFVDIDTQIDFMFPAGALYVSGAERVLPAVARLNDFAAAHAIPLISTTDAHSENDPEFQQWPPHCVVGTAGQSKAPETLLADRATLSFEPGASVELASQVIVEKQVLDVFTNPNFPGLLAHLKADCFVVYGVATDYCVRCALGGLLPMGKPVVLVTDAIAAVNAEDGARVISEFTARGGTLATTDRVLNG